MNDSFLYYVIRIINYYPYILLLCFVFQNYPLNQRDIFQHVPITSRKPVKPDSKGVPGFFAFWGSSRILANPGAS